MKTVGGSSKVSPKRELTEGVSIDDYGTWRATRFAAAGETG